MTNNYNGKWFTPAGTAKPPTPSGAPSRVRTECAARARLLVEKAESIMSDIPPTRRRNTKQMVKRTHAARRNQASVLASLRRCDRLHDLRSDFLGDKLA